MTQSVRADEKPLTARSADDGKERELSRAPVAMQAGEILLCKHDANVRFGWKADIIEGDWSDYNLTPVKAIVR